MPSPFYERILRRLLENPGSPAADTTYIMYHYNTGALTREEAIELLDMPRHEVPCNAKGGAC